MLSREAELRALGGAGFPPHALHASPAAVCGPGGSHADECLRTLPPREHGGNLDIRYLQVGVTVYLPCYVPGCGLAIGDPHFAQGDGEVSGTAIEMDADFTVTTRLITDGPALTRGPHFEGPVRVLDIPSRRFYATTGFPLKAVGEIPPDMRYLGASERIAGLRNLSKDVSLAARNALLAMIDYMTATYDLTPEQAYVVASVAVDLRIAQLVDAPNVGVTALLPTRHLQGAVNTSALLMRFRKPGPKPPGHEARSGPFAPRPGRRAGASDRPPAGRPAGVPRVPGVCAVERTPVGSVGCQAEPKATIGGLA